MPNFSWYYCSKAACSILSDQHFLAEPPAFCEKPAVAPSVSRGPTRTRIHRLNSLVGVASGADLISRTEFGRLVGCTGNVFVCRDGPHDNPPHELTSGDIIVNPAR